MPFLLPAPPDFPPSEVLPFVAVLLAAPSVSLLSSAETFFSPAGTELGPLPASPAALAAPSPPAGLVAASELAADLFLDGFRRVGLRSRVPLRSPLPFELAEDGRGGPGGTSESPDLTLLGRAVLGVEEVGVGAPDIVDDSA